MFVSDKDWLSESDDVFCTISWTLEQDTFAFFKLIVGQYSMQPFCVLGSLYLKKLSFIALHQLIL